MFLDTYYDVEDESIEDYEPNPPGSEDGDQMPEDPLRAGAAADKPTLDPRLYFLQVLAIRIGRVNMEWQQVVQVLGNHIRAAVSPFASSFPGLAGVVPWDSRLPAMAALAPFCVPRGNFSSNTNGYPDKIFYQRNIVLAVP
jgi:hypothetical protein